MALDIVNQRKTLPWRQRLGSIHWPLVTATIMLACIGFVMLYSAAYGNLDPWARPQMIRFGFSLGLMLVIALIDIRIWARYAIVFYLAVLSLLIFVEFAGTAGMGATRWLNLGAFRYQPSEPMKIALLLVLARYFHMVGPDGFQKFRNLIVPLILIATPVVLVVRQPDLGTAVLLAASGVAVCFMAGLRIWLLGAVGIASLAMLPVAWAYLHDYQKARLLTFLSPQDDPLATGYHIIQAKIALGSGGFFGRGILKGTQSYLDFLPERHTDFIFAMLAEELGFVGGLVVIVLYGIIIASGFRISANSRSQFGALLAIGISTTLFLNMYTNMAMSTGLIPVVGAPLPLISYGGTSMLTTMIAIGLLLNVHIHSSLKIRQSDM